MKLLQIVVEGNTGSTGVVAESLGNIAMKMGWESYIAHGRFSRASNSVIIKIGRTIDILWHGIETRIFDRHGLGSRRATKKLISQIKQIKPDIIHLHHLHGYYINIKFLFEYLKTSKIPIVWTFHDCWAFTGHCAYFDFVGCTKWQSECFKCPQKTDYPASFFLDRSNKNFHLKKLLFTSIPNLYIVTVSDWLNKLVYESFFKGIKIKTIYNGTNLDIFKPYDNIDNLREKYNIPNKFVILGVASPWVRRKGLSEFIKLSACLKSDEVIVLVGLNFSQMKNLPSNIIGISKTENRQQLAEIYSSSDVFANLTLEDNFPTTNIEALACGTPVITYNTGGSPEAICSKTGIVVDKYSIASLINAIDEIKRIGKVNYIANCRKRAETYFMSDKQYLNYFELYKEIINSNDCI